ncbi:DUF3347 domain-containing protein [Flavitalea antarctica]
MRTFLKITIPVFASVLIISCGESSTDNTTANAKDTSAHADHVGADSSSNTTASVNVKDDKLNAIYQHYVHLTTALVNNDAAEAKIASNAIEAGARELTGGTSIAATAAKITNAADIEGQRKAYSTLSNDFIALVKKSGMSSGELYVDFCPMAMNDKGAYWVSSKKEIRNPYFGDKMLTCGEVKETIK